MRAPPRNISVYTADSQAFADFLASMSSGETVPEEGILVRYAVFGGFAKLGMSLFSLVLSIGLFFSPESPGALLPSGTKIVGLAILILLLLCVKERFGEAWFIVQKQRLFIKRWKLLRPGCKMIILDRKNVLSVRYHEGLKVSKSPRSYCVKAVLKDSKTELGIMNDTNAEKIRWLAELLSSWRKNDPNSLTMPQEKA